MTRAFVIHVLLYCTMQLHGMNTNVKHQEFIVQNHLYEPIFVKYIDPITNRSEHQKIDPHTFMPFTYLPDALFISLQRKSKKSAFIKSKKFPPLVQFVHIIRKRSSENGLDCYSTDIPIRELRTLLFEMKSQNTSQAVEDSGDEKSEE